MPLFNDGDLIPKPFRIYPNVTSGSGHEQLGLWVASQAQPPGSFFWNMGVGRSYANNSEIEIAIERETLRRQAEGLPNDRGTVMRYLILKSGLFKPRDSGLLDALGLPLITQDDED